MRFAAIFLFMVISVQLRAQTKISPDTLNPDEIELKVGDTMEIGVCKGPRFEHLDYFKKTRWAGEAVPFDTSTGEGFYKSFFVTGDFDAFELDSSFSGRKFVIMGMEVLTNKNTGKEMPVLYLTGPDPNSVIWVDFTEAMQSREIGLAGHFNK